MQQEPVLALNTTTSLTMSSAGLLNKLDSTSVSVLPFTFTSTSHTSATTTIEVEFNSYDYTLDIVMPLIVGLLVALILGWMLVRYKMSAHQRSNYNGSIYCCPEKCFDFCAKFCQCNLKIKIPKKKKSTEYNHPQIIVRHSENINLIELAPLNNPRNLSPTTNNRSSIRSTASILDYKNPNGLMLPNSNIFETCSLTSSSTIQQQPQQSQTQSNQSNNSYLNPNTLNIPFRFLKRESISSRRSSILQMPDLMRSGNFTNVFHSFHSKNSTTLA